MYKVTAAQSQSLANSPFDNISFTAIMFGSSTRGIAIAISYTGNIKFRPAYDTWRSWT
jgi:hypothetical protein